MKDESLTHEQRIFLFEIAKDFNLQDSPANKAILYEVTGYKDQASTFEFWKDYGDSHTPGDPKIPNGSAAKEPDEQTRRNLVQDISYASLDSIKSSKGNQVMNHD